MYYLELIQRFWDFNKTAKISPDTVRTILTPSKSDKRPKAHKRIDLDKML